MEIIDVNYKYKYKFKLLILKIFHYETLFY